MLTNFQKALQKIEQEFITTIKNGSNENKNRCIKKILHNFNDQVLTLTVDDNNNIYIGTRWNHGTGYLYKLDKQINLKD